MIVTGPTWSAAGLDVRPTLPPLPSLGIRAQLTPPARHRGAVLGPESTRSLRDWLTWWLSDRGVSPAPPDPDRIRYAIERQRVVLRSTSYDAGTGERAEWFRAGLAWGETALKAVAIEAGERS